MGFGTGNLGMGITFSLNNQASAPAAAAGRSISKLSQTVTNAGAKITSAANNITSGLVGVTIVVGSLLAPFIGITKAAADFDSIMSELSAKANLDKTSASMLDMRKEALALGEATKFSAKEVGKGQVFLAQAGFKSNQILSAMPPLLSLAAAGNLDLASASDIASNILTAMSLKATDMSRVADVLASAATSANVSVRQMGESFKFAAGPAKLLGFSIEQTSALVGLLGNMGVQGSLAGTAIQNMAAFIGKMDEKKLNKVGLAMGDITDSSGNLLSIQVVMDKILGSITKFGNVKQLKTLNELFGLRGGKASFAVQKSFKGLGLTFDDFVKKLEKSSGSANAMAKKMLDNLSGDVVKFKSIIETTAIIAGGGLAESLRPVVRMVTSLTSSIKDFISTNVGQWFIKAAAGAAALTAGLIILGFASTVLIPAIWTMVTAAGALVIAFLPIIAAVAAVVGSVIFLKKSIQRFQDVLNGAEVQDGFIGFMQKVGGAFKGLMMVWNTWNGETFTLTKEMHDTLENMNILDFVLNVGTYVLRMKTFWEGFKDGVTESWAAIKPQWKEMNRELDKLIDNFGEYDKSIEKADSKLSFWERAGKTMGSIPGFLGKEIVESANGLLQILNAIIDSVKELAGLASATLTGGLSGLLEQIQKNLSGKDYMRMGSSSMLGAIANIVAGEDVINMPNNQNRLSLADVTPTNPFASVGVSADLAAKHRASGLNNTPSPAIVDKSVVTQGNITIVSQLDGEKIGETFYTKEMLLDNLD